MQLYSQERLSASVAGPGIVNNLSSRRLCENLNVVYNSRWCSSSSQHIRLAQVDLEVMADTSAPSPEFPPVIPPILAQELIAEVDNWPLNTLLFGMHC